MVSGKEGAAEKLSSVEVKKLTDAAADLLCKCREVMGDDFSQWAQQQEALLDSGARKSEAKVREIFRRAHKCLLCGTAGEEKGEKGEKPGAGEEAVYCVRGRPVPVVTERDVDRAVGQLAGDERAQLLMEFEAQQSAASERAGVGDGAALPAKDESRAAEDATPGLYKNEDSDELPPMEFGKSERRSFVLGNKLVELTYEGDVWAPEIDDATTFQTSGNLGRDMFEIVNFDAPDACNNKRRVPRAVLPVTRSLKKPSSEISKENFIRDRVRMQLLANSVVKDIEQLVADSLSTDLSEWESERDRALKERLDRQTKILQEAMEVLQSVKRLDTKAMGAYVRDPYYKQAWQRDETAKNCHDCRRLFAYGVTYHHCRRCGFIFCNTCSSYFGMLPDKHDRMHAKSAWMRLCRECYETCCKHQRSASAVPCVPKVSYARDTRAPDDPVSVVLSGVSVTDDTLEDNLPPFYVVLPEEWYTAKRTTMSGWFHSLKFIPYAFFENVQGAVSSLSGVVVPKVCGLLMGKEEQAGKFITRD